MKTNQKGSSVLQVYFVCLGWMIVIVVYIDPRGWHFLTRTIIIIMTMMMAAFFFFVSTTTTNVASARSARIYLMFNNNYYSFMQYFFRVCGAPISRFGWSLMFLLLYLWLFSKKSTMNFVVLRYNSILSFYNVIKKFFACKKKITFYQNHGRKYCSPTARSPYKP